MVRAIFFGTKPMTCGFWSWFYGLAKVYQVLVMADSEGAHDMAMGASLINFVFEMHRVLIKNALW